MKHDLDIMILLGMRDTAVGCHKVDAAVHRIYDSPHVSAVFTRSRYIADEIQQSSDPAV